MKKNLYFSIRAIKMMSLITSRYLQIDKDDKEILVMQDEVLGEMYRLAEKYGNRGFAVLFEVK